MAAYWPLSPTTLALAPGLATVFRLDLDLPEARLPFLADLLGMEERLRAGRLKRDGDRRRFVAAHGQMRQVLAAYLRRMPDELCFGNSPSGKPYVEGGGLFFNLSHSQSIGLLAVAAEFELGVDVEAIRDSVDYLDIARHFFAPGEVAALLGLPEAQRLSAFFHCWTRKEAYMKANGAGLFMPLDTFEVSVAPGSPPRLLNQPAGGNWILYNLDLSPQHAAALAVPAWVGPPKLYTWPAP